MRAFVAETLRFCRVADAADIALNGISSVLAIWGERECVR
jgi:hypothetical protein